MSAEGHELRQQKILGLCICHNVPGDVTTCLKHQTQYVEGYHTPSQSEVKAFMEPFKLAREENKIAIPIVPIDAVVPQPEAGGQKFDQEKPRMDLLPMDALLEVAKVLTFRAKKYGDHNWEKGIHRDRLRAAQMRHDAAVMMGEEKDPESGFLHVAHKACDVLMELALKLRHLDEVI